VVYRRISFNISAGAHLRSSKAGTRLLAALHGVTLSALSELGALLHHWR